MRGGWLESGCAVVGVQVLAAVAVLAASRGERHLRRVLPYVVATAVGVLLGTAALHLLPEAIEALGRRPGIWVVLLATMAALFGLERAVHHVSGVNAEPAPDLDEQPCEDIHSHSHAHTAARPASLLAGALTHSLVDGTSIAAAFALDHRVGWMTACAVGLHEVPHRVGDFALLLHMDVQRVRAALLAVAAGFAGLLGWGLVIALGDTAPAAVSWLLPVSAGSFIYISLFDLLPEVVQVRQVKTLTLRLIAVALGAAVAVALSRIPGA